MDSTATFWLPPQASTTAGDVDSLFAFVFWMSLFFFVLIVAGMIVFAVKYRRSKVGVQKDTQPSHSTALEMTWIVIPTILVMVIFVWGFRGFMRMSVVPSQATEIKVTGQKWSWTFQYPEGPVTTNELVVPAGRPIRLLMSSQDVIHSFYVPAFRVKKDVLPNRYSLAWFEATYPGEYDLFCAEYCGTSHSGMVGKVRVVTDEEYSAWIDQQMTAGEGMSPVDFGARLYVSRTCNTCHSVDGSPGNGPTFQGIWGHEVELRDGSTVLVDENYVRESILNPMSKIVNGFQPIMPTYQGILRDAEVDALVAYIRSVTEGRPADESHEEPTEVVAGE